jgi:(4-(4-[2-(gamma-L-glutamylamino)ethyl]phenoxymethyl)furan-2-yl)methanamine synthase
MSSNIVGWDIGGVNTKVALLNGRNAPRALSVPFEIQHEPSALSSVLRSAVEELGSGSPGQHAVTMTAELSQAFRSKREGVGFVLDAFESVFPPERIHVYTVGGEFVSPSVARSRVLDVAASNWAATSRWVAARVPDCILLDIGSTTTDLIPIVQGRLAVRGRTDPERLLSGELVYTGAVRTPVETVARRVPLWGGLAGVSAEGFATMGDVHLWLGSITPGDYGSPTADGRPATKEFAGERLARVVCADREMLDESAIQTIATALAQAQLQQIVAALAGLRSRHPAIDLAVTSGLGDFIASEAARCAGMSVKSLAAELGNAAITAPAVAVAHLLRDWQEK